MKKKESLFDEYGQFFQDYNERDDKSTFAIKLNDNCLPELSCKKI